MSILFSNDTIILKGFTTQNVLKVDYNNQVNCLERFTNDPSAQFTIVHAIQSHGTAPLQSGDRVYLRNVRTGNYLEVSGNAVLCHSNYAGAAQTFEIVRQIHGAITSNSDLWLKANTGGFLHLDPNGIVGCRWDHTHRGGYEHLTIEKESSVSSSHYGSSSSSNVDILRNSGISVTGTPVSSGGGHLGSNAAILSSSGIVPNSIGSGISPSTSSYRSNAQLVNQSAMSSTVPPQSSFSEVPHQSQSVASVSSSSFNNSSVCTGFTSGPPVYHPTPQYNDTPQYASPQQYSHNSGSPQSHHISSSKNTQQHQYTSGQLPQVQYNSSSSYHQSPPPPYNNTPPQQQFGAPYQHQYDQSTPQQQQYTLGPQQEQYNSSSAYQQSPPPLYDDNPPQQQYDAPPPPYDQSAPPQLQQYLDPQQQYTLQQQQYVDPQQQQYTPGQSPHHDGQGFYPEPPMQQFTEQLYDSSLPAPPQNGTGLYPSLSSDMMFTPPPPTVQFESCSQARPKLFYILCVNNNIVLDVDASTQSVIQSTKNGDASQLWFHDPLTRGVILNKQSGFALDHDVYNHQCVVRIKNGLPSQVWDMKKNRLHNKFRHDDNWVLEVPRLSQEGGQVLMVVDKRIDSEYQKFVFQDNSEETQYQGQAGFFCPNPVDVAYNQPMRIKSAHNKKLFIHCNNLHEDASVCVWTETSSQQKFLFTNEGYILCAENQAFCLELKPSSGEVFVSRKRFAPNDDLNDPFVIQQKWNVFPVGKSKIIMSVANPNMALSLTRTVGNGKGEIIRGSPVHNEKPTKQQMWRFETVNSQSVSKYVTYNQPLYVSRKGVWDIDKDVLKKHGGHATIKEWKTNLVRTKNQQWIFTEQGFIYPEVNQDLVLTSNGPGRPLSLVQRYPYNNLNQKWIVERTEQKSDSGSVLILSAENPKYCVDSKGYKLELFLGLTSGTTGWNLKT